MKRQALFQIPQKAFHLSWVSGMFLVMSFIIPCTFGCDSNIDCGIDPTILTGSYQTTDACSMPFGNADYTITIDGSCSIYTISNLFAPNSQEDVTLLYEPSPLMNNPDPFRNLRVPTQEYQGRTIYGSGTITKADGKLTLDLILPSAEDTITCTVTGVKK